MLIGSFGIGKTTVCLNAANDKDLGVVYARAQNIVRLGGTIGENYLLGKIGEDLDLFADLLEGTAAVLRRDLGPTLARILRNNEQEFLLVIDGLDEHPFYSTPLGLHTLTNELAALRCAIVLTTRREHFDLLANDFGRVLQGISSANGLARDVEVGMFTEEGNRGDRAIREIESLHFGEVDDILESTCVEHQLQTWILKRPARVSRDDDRANRYAFARILLDASAFGVRIATVANRALALFMCHN